MIYRSFDKELLAETMEPYLSSLHDFDIDEIVDNNENILLTDTESEGSFVILEYERPGVYWVHNFYRVRGRRALEFAEAATEYAFNNLPIEVIQGLTPTDNLKARWFARSAGFKSHGIIKTFAGPMEMFILTRKEYYE